mmetsp:Transcript_35752/g.63784  ORF Transcript_35752/g.63784 Transcript_35752/m.63784 type:complete len:271 (+) Transcript_35752:487-1299(+)
MGYEDGGGAVVGADVLQGVEVLGNQHQVHHGLRVHILHLVGKKDYRFAKAVDDCLPLPCDTLPREKLGLRVRLRCLDHLNLFRLCAFNCRDAQPLSGVDIVHGALHLRGRVDIGNQCLDDRKTEGGHIDCQLALDGGRDLFLCSEHVVEVDLRDGAAHNIEDVASNLAAAVRELVEGVDKALLDHLVLYAYHHCHKHVVHRLGLAAHVELLDAQAEVARDALADIAVDAVEARVSNAVELAKLGHDTHGGLVHAAVAAPHGTLRLYSAAV